MVQLRPKHMFPISLKAKHVLVKLDVLLWNMTRFPFFLQRLSSSSAHYGRFNEEDKDGETSGMISQDSFLLMSEDAKGAFKKKSLWKSQRLLLDCLHNESLNGTFCRPADKP